MAVPDVRRPMKHPEQEPRRPLMPSVELEPGRFGQHRMEVGVFEQADMIDMADMVDMNLAVTTLLTLDSRRSTTPRRHRPLRCPRLRSLPRLDCIRFLIQKEQLDERVGVPLEGLRQPTDHIDLGQAAVADDVARIAPERLSQRPSRATAHGQGHPDQQLESTAALLRGIHRGTRLPSGGRVAPKW